MKLNIGTIRSNSSGFDAIADIAVKTKDVWLDSIELDLSFCSFSKPIWRHRYMPLLHDFVMS